MGEGGGYSDIFIHIPTAWTIFFLVQNFEIHYFIYFLGGGGGGSEKINSFGGMKKLWIFLRDHYIIGLIWGGGRYVYTF